MKKMFKENRKLLLSVSLILVFFVLYFAFILKKPFILCNDQLFQYDVFYAEWLRLIDDFFHGKGLPMYSWNMYLGTDFYSSMAYYCTGDIFIPILYLFKDNLSLGLIVESILCVYIAALTMSCFLRKAEVKEDNTVIFISLIYTFGGMAMSYYGQYMWFRFLAFMPLLFNGILTYFKEGKRWLFAVAVTVCFLQSYYYMWPVTVFILIFCLYYEFRNGRKKELGRDFLNLVLAYVTGLCLSAFLIIPAALYVLHNPRVGSVKDMSLFWDLLTYIGLYLNPITNNPQLIVDTLFTSSHGVYNFFIGIIPFVPALAYCIRKDNKAELYTTMVLVAIMVIRPLDSFMHGFSESSLRWVLVFELWLLYLGALALNRKQKKEDRIAGWYLISCGLIMILLFAGKMFGEIHKEELTFIVFGILCAVIIYRVYQDNRSLAMLFIVIEMLVCLSYQFKLETDNFVLKNEDEFNQSQIALLQDEDHDTFRIYSSYENYNPGSNLNLNRSLYYGYMTTQTYNSLYDAHTYPFQLKNGIDNWMIDINNPHSLNALGVKYFIYSPEETDSLPRTSVSAIHIEDMGYYRFVSNPDYRGFGYTATQIKHWKEFKDLSELDDTVFVDDERDLTIYYKPTYHKFNIAWRTNTSLVGDIEVENDNILFIPIPYNEGWKVLLDGNTVTPLSVNGGFMGIELNAGHHDIEMYFVSPGFKPGLAVTGLGLMGLLFIIIDDRKKRK